MAAAHGAAAELRAGLNLPTLPPGPEANPFRDRLRPSAHVLARESVVESVERAIDLPLRAFLEHLVYYRLDPEQRLAARRAARHDD